MTETAAYVTATRTAPPHALGARFHDQKPFQSARRECEALIRLQPDPARISCRTAPVIVL